MIISAVAGTQYCIKQVRWCDWWRWEWWWNSEIDCSAKYCLFYKSRLYNYLLEWRLIVSYSFEELEDSIFLYILWIVMVVVAGIQNIFNTCWWHSEVRNCPSTFVPPMLLTNVQCFNQNSIIMFKKEYENFLAFYLLQKVQIYI